METKKPGEPGFTYRLFIKYLSLIHFSIGYQPFSNLDSI